MPVAVPLLGVGVGRSSCWDTFSPVARIARTPKDIMSPSLIKKDSFNTYSLTFPLMYLSESLVLLFGQLKVLRRTEGTTVHVRCCRLLMHSEQNSGCCCRTFTRLFSIPFSLLSLRSCHPVSFHISNLSSSNLSLERGSLLRSVFRESVKTLWLVAKAK